MSFLDFGRIPAKEAAGSGCPLQSFCKEAAKRISVRIPYAAIR